MNYLVKTKENKYIVMSNVSKDWTKYIGTSTYISLGKEFFRVIQEIEIR
jgi:hypothetical protein